MYLQIDCLEKAQATSLACIIFLYPYSGVDIFTQGHSRTANNGSIWQCGLSPRHGITCACTWQAVLSGKKKQCRCRNLSRSTGFIVPFCYCPVPVFLGLNSKQKLFNLQLKKFKQYILLPEFWFLKTFIGKRRKTQNVFLFEKLISDPSYYKKNGPY